MIVLQNMGVTVDEVQALLALRLSAEPETI